MTWTPYKADRYLNYEEVETFCHEIAVAHLNWVSMSVITLIWIAGKAGQGMHSVTLA